MNTHNLYIFTAVYRHRSFTKAAQQINISQPTVSEHIKNLENELECQLFDRVGKTIEPTSSAKKLFPKALQILEDISQVKAELLGGEDVVKGEIIFGASTIPSTYILPPLIKKFRHIYPDIFFKIKIEDSLKINQMILENELYCGIVGAKMTGNALRYEPFFKDELCLVASPELTEIGEINTLPFIIREKGSGTRKSMEENFKRIGITLKKRQIVAEFGSTAAIKEAAKSGLGVAVISQLAVTDEIENNTLSPISFHKEKMNRYFYLVHHQNRTLPSHYFKFCQFLKKMYSYCHLSEPC